jgi:hypothetical protein
MEKEIASILVSFARSIADDPSASSVLNRVHVVRNTIVLRMDWRVVHCPAVVSNHILHLLHIEEAEQRRRRMAVVCDLAFSSLTGNESFFTHSVSISEDTAPEGPK